MCDTDVFSPAGLQKRGGGAVPGGREDGEACSLAFWKRSLPAREVTDKTPSGQIYKLKRGYWGRGRYLQKPSLPPNHD